MGVLDGIRVLDFGRFIAGPYCAALLADLGADVIRVERVGGGEDRWITPVTSDGVGSIYLQCNRGKRGLTLDPSAASSRWTIRSGHGWPATGRPGCSPVTDQSRSGESRPGHPAASRHPPSASRPSQC